MVAPDYNLCDISNNGACLFCDLPDSPVVVESGHGCEVFLGEILGVGGSDQTVCIGGVADNEGFDISVGVVVDGSALGNKYFSVFLEKVSSLHSLSSGFGSNQKSSLDILES